MVVLICYLQYPADVKAFELLYFCIAFSASADSDIDPDVSIEGMKQGPPLTVSHLFPLPAQGAHHQNSSLRLRGPGDTIAVVRNIKMTEYPNSAGKNSRMADRPAEKLASS